MPITYNGIKKCEKCNKDFKWFCFEQIRQPYRQSGLYTVESFPADEAKASVITRNDNEIVLETECFFCHARNTISVSKTK